MDVVTPADRANELLTGIDETMLDADSMQIIQLARAHIALAALTTQATIARYLEDISDSLGNIQLVLTDIALNSQDKKGKLNAQG